MPNRTLHGIAPSFSASCVLDALGKALGEIKAQDRLTWSDVGAVLGVSEDQAAKYADGSATMNAVTKARGKREWGSRFTGYYDRLCEETRPGARCDRAATTVVLKAAYVLNEALVGDVIPRGSVLNDRATLEAAIEAIKAQLAKLTDEPVRYSIIGGDDVIVLQIERA